MGAEPLHGEADFAPMLDALDVPVLVIGSDAATLFTNSVWRETFGEPPAGEWAFLGKIAAQDRDRVQRALQRAIDSRRAAEFDFSVQRRSGEYSTLSCSVNPFPDERRGDASLVCICWDITEQRRHEERLAFMAGHDPLTGLPNRRAFEEALGRAVSRAQRGSTSALLLLDMDHLKEFNDRRGHLDGDQALVNLALLLRRHVRAGDLPARIGGDEFAVLLEDADANEAEEIAQRIREAAASEEFVPGAREHRLGVSGGIAPLEAGVDARGVIDRADAALYSAKNAGRDRIVLWTPEVGALASPERMASRVRAAFVQDGFRLLYQPVVRLTDGSVAYFESLVRMSDGSGGLVAPAEFLPVVERLGLMPRLTRRVVDLALWELAACPTASLSINLSPSDLGDEELLEEVVGVVSGAEASRTRLLFEVNESTLLSNLGGGRAWMERLASKGCRFVLDNFGTGVGMFMLLREPHIDHVKLARAVMRAVAAEEGNRIFVGALRELIESQGKTAVAGYLETDELLRDVISAGFEWGQGFRLHEPADDLARLIEETSTKSEPDGSLAE